MTNPKVDAGRWLASPPAKPDARRLRVVHAALKYMHRYGSEKLNVVEVARRAKVARATVYNYFGSREALLDAVFDHLEGEYMSELERTMRRHERFDDQVAAAIVFVSESWENPSHAVWFGFVSPVDEPLLVVDRFADSLRSLSRFLKPFIEEGQKRGELRADLDPDAVAEWVSRIVLSYSVSHATVPMQKPERVAEFVRAHLVRGLS